MDPLGIWYHLSSRCVSLWLRTTVLWFGMPNGRQELSREHTFIHVPLWSQSFTNSAREICIRHPPYCVCYLCPPPPFGYYGGIRCHSPCAHKRTHMSDGDDSRLSPLLIWLCHLWRIFFFFFLLCPPFCSDCVYSMLNILSICDFTHFFPASVFLIQFAPFHSISTFSPFVPVPRTEKKASEISPQSCSSAAQAGRQAV